MDRQSQDRSQNTNRKREWRRGKDSAPRDKNERRKAKLTPNAFFFFPTCDKKFKRDPTCELFYQVFHWQEEETHVSSAQGSLLLNLCNFACAFCCFPFSNFVPFCRITFASLCCVHRCHLRFAIFLKMQNSFEM